MRTAPELPSDAPRRTCRCGHERDHPMVSANPQYSFIGWCAILTGISWEPTSAAFTCRRCDETFETVSDPTELKKLRLYG